MKNAILVMVHLLTRLAVLLGTGGTPPVGFLPPHHSSPPVLDFIALQTITPLPDGTQNFGRASSQKEGRYAIVHDATGQIMFRCTIIWEKIIVIIWANPFQARESVSAWPQFPLMCAAGMRRSGIWEVEHRLFRALVGGTSACITHCGLAASDASSRDVQTAARSRRMPLYYGERSWNSLKLRSFLQVVDAGGFTPMTYATSRSDMSSGVMTECEENPPLTSVISVQRNTPVKRVVGK
jgi:hypothetical protein